VWPYLGGDRRITPRLWETRPDALEREGLARLEVLRHGSARHKLMLFRQGEHDDLFDALQTMGEETMSYATVRFERHSPLERW
jgi:hypothetical protein